MTWYLICEVISWVIFSDHSLVQKGGKPSLIPTETKTGRENKDETQTASPRGSHFTTAAVAPLAQSALSWTQPPLHQPPKAAESDFQVGKQLQSPYSNINTSWSFYRISPWNPKMSFTNVCAAFSGYAGLCLLFKNDSLILKKISSSDLS